MSQRNAYEYLAYACLRGSVASAKGASMAVEAIDHVQLAMPAGGEDAARGFYRDLLGLPEVPKPATLAVRGGCWFERGPVKIHLGVEADFRPAKKAHPALVVTDLQTLLDACRARGIVVSDAESLDGWRRVHVHDPFGNRIELMERHTSMR